MRPCWKKWLIEALRFIARFHLLFSVWFLNVDAVWSASFLLLLPRLSFPLSCLPHHVRLHPFGTVNHNKLFLSLATFCQRLYNCQRKATNIDGHRWQRLIGEINLNKKRKKNLWVQEARKRKRDLAWSWILWDCLLWEHLEQCWLKAVELQLAGLRGQNVAHNCEGELKNQAGVWLWREQIWCKPLEGLRIPGIGSSELQGVTNNRNSNKSDNDFWSVCWFGVDVTYYTAVAGFYLLLPTMVTHPALQVRGQGPNQHSTESMVKSLAVRWTWAESRCFYGLPERFPLL